MGAVPVRAVWGGVAVAGSQLALGLISKVTTGILRRPPPCRQRLSNGLPRAANKGVLSGSLTRIPQSTSDDELLTMCTLAIIYEARHYKLADCIIKQVISDARTKARERKERKVERALAKESLALET